MTLSDFFLPVLPNFTAGKFADLCNSAHVISRQNVIRDILHVPLGYFIPTANEYL